jgi:hypothetical protein
MKNFQFLKSSVYFCLTGRFDQVLAFVEGTDVINRHLFLGVSKKLNARFALFYSN